MGRLYNNGMPDDREDHFFRWDPPERTPIFGAVAVPGLEVSIALRRGAVNNCDLYLSVPVAWLTGANTGVTLLIPTFNLYRIVAGARHLLRTVQIADASNGVQHQAVSTATIQMQLIVARGFPCDGFEVTVETDAGVPLSAADFAAPCSGMLYTWGTETSAAPEGSTTGGGGGIAADVTIVGPTPLPVSLTASSATVAVAEAPASAGLDLVGTAPSGGVATALAAHAVQREVVVVADSTNTGTVYVSFGAVAIAAASTPLGPGDSRRFLVANTALLFLNADLAAQTYRVAVT